MTRGLAAWILGSLRRPPATAEALAIRQSARLHRLVRYAFRFSPYYRTVFQDLRLRPSDIRCAADLARLPILEKEVVRERIGELTSTEADPRSIMRRKTSGSSGLPLELPETALERFVSNLHWARCYMDCGGSPWQRQAKIVLPSQIPPRRRPRERLGLFRREYIDATLPPDAKIERLRRLNPDLLVAWGTMLEEIGWRLEDTDSALDIPLVCSTASSLWPDARRRAGERLRARVFDLYGAAETGPVAWECGRHEGYHVHSDLVVVEILDDAGRPAPRGRLVCTVLWRRTLPLIRYAIGDTAEWSDGSHGACNLPYPVIRALTGRESETIPLANGMRISSFALRDALFERSRENPGQLTPRRGVAQFQMIQESSASFRLRIVPGPGFSPDVERAILDAFDRQFGGAIRLRIVSVGRIESPPGVKFSPMISLVTLRRLREQGIPTEVFTGES